MTNKNTETTASVSVYELNQIRKEVDRELETEFGGVFAQKRTYKKAAAYVGALGDPLVAVKSCWGMAEGAGNETPGQFQSLIGENKWASEEMWDGTAIAAGRDLGKNYGGDQLGPGMVVDETADEKTRKAYGWGKPPVCRLCRRNNQLRYVGNDELYRPSRENLGIGSDVPPGENMVHRRRRDWDCPAGKGRDTR